MQIHLKIEGMHCAGCARAVQTVLSNVDQVNSAVVDLEAGEALITASSSVDQAALVAAIDDAGYAVTVTTGR